jgi:hypothetical protein
MPLKPGSDNETISNNVSELMSTGKYPQKQAVAIAESEARRTSGVGVKKGRKVGVKKK